MFRLAKIAVSSIGIASLLISTAKANPQPTQYGYPIIPLQANREDLPCYMTTATLRTLDLARLCGSVPTSTNAGISAIGAGGGNSARGGNGSSGSGPCQYSWQRDAAGRLCGGRAASERPGGNTSGYRNSAGSTGNSSNSESVCSAQSQAFGMRCITPTQLAPNRTFGDSGSSSFGNTNSFGNSNSSSSSGTCYVNSYTRRDGTPVSGYTRRC